MTASTNTGPPVAADAERHLRAGHSVTLVAPFGFGWFKGRFTGAPSFVSAVQTFVIGGAAAAAAYETARLVH